MKVPTFLKHSSRHFQRTLVGIALSASVVVASSAQTQTADAKPAAVSTQPAQAKAKPVQGLFWKATSATDTIYLLGSVHLASAKMYPLPAQIEDAFKDAKTLVVEVDLNKIDQTKFAALFQQKGMYPEGDGLTKHLSPADQKKLTTTLNKYNFPAVAMDRMKPWLASLTLSIIPFLSIDMKPENGIDQYFLQKAMKSGKTVDQAENVDFQMDLLSNVSDKDALAALHNELNGEADTSTKFANDLQDSWIAGDAAGVQKLMDASRPADKSDRKLLEDRNPHMADVAEGYLKANKSCFFVVGAAHLIGPEGVVAILKKRGYVLTQIGGTGASMPSK